ncbi:MAG: molybdopterin dinucleotide binding domain-containing protein, partial [Myxococcota bacterium]
RGGGFTTSNSRAHRIDVSAAIAADAPPTRRINMNRVGRALTEPLDPPVKVLFTYCSNPLATLPNRPMVAQGLARDDLFHVVFEQVMTDTARWADVLLPATTFLEHDDVTRGYGAMVINRVRPVVERWGESRPNYEVFAQLCERMGLDEPGDPVGADALVEAIVAASDDSDRVREELKTVGVARPSAGHQPIPLRDIAPRTADGKIHLVPPDLDAEAPLGLYGYQPDPGDALHPLALISPASAKTVNSTFGQLDRRPAAVVVHPQDATTRGIVEGASVRIDSALGSVHCRAHISDHVRPGVVSLAKGLWSHRMGGDGSTANAVAPDTLTDLGGGATFNDARVQLIVT